MKMKGHCFCSVERALDSEPKVQSTKSKKKWFKKKRRAVSHSKQTEITPATAPILPPVVTCTETPNSSGANKEDAKHAYTTPIVELMKLNGVDKEDAKQSGVDEELTEQCGIDKELAKHAYAVALSTAKVVEPSAETKRLIVEKSAKPKMKWRKKWYKKKRLESTITRQAEITPTTATIPPVIPLSEPQKLSGVDKEEVKHADTTPVVESMKPGEVHRGDSIPAYTTQIAEVIEVDREDSKHAYSNLIVDLSEHSGVNKEDAKHTFTNPTVKPTKVSVVDEEDAKHASTAPIMELAKVSGVVKEDVTPIIEPEKPSGVVKEDDEHSLATPIIELKKLNGNHKEDSKQIYTTPIAKPVKLSGIAKEDGEHSFTTPLNEPDELSGDHEEDSKQAYKTLIAAPKKLSGVDKEEAKETNMTPIVEPTKLSGVQKKDSKRTFTTPVVKSVKLSGAHKEDSKQAYTTPLIEPMKSGGLDKGGAKQAKSVSPATPNANSAAAEMVRRTFVGLFGDTSKEELAAIKIQTAYRGYMGKRRLRAIRGLMTLKSVMHQRQGVKRQGSNTLKSMQTLAAFQSQFRERILKVAQENVAAQKCKRATLTREITSS